MGRLNGFVVRSLCKANFVAFMEMVRTTFRERKGVKPNISDGLLYLTRAARSLHSEDCTGRQRKNNECVVCLARCPEKVNVSLIQMVSQVAHNTKTNSKSSNKAPSWRVRSCRSVKPWSQTRARYGCRVVRQGRLWRTSTFLKASDSKKTGAEV